MPSKPLTRLYFGVSVCRDCHGKADPVPEKDAFLYRGTEMHTWENLDKHKHATRVLQGERSKLIAVNLGWKHDLTNEPRCLSCHGVVISDEKEVHEDSFKPPQRIESGVGCVVCHGAYKDWVRDHIDPFGNWKKLTRADKAKLGLRDMWDPEVRAALCCSCHIGNIKEGKLVTHEMYAAGHPPLPGIEVATFCEAMPRHWETLKEKVTKRPEHKDFHRRIHGFDADGEELAAARLLSVSSVVAFRTSTQLVHELAGGAAKREGKEASWPELAAFDCYACHHDLKSESWRQLRGPGRPGRPQLRAWPTALAETVTRALRHDGPAEFRSLAKEMEAVFSKTPFGHASLVADRADALVKWSGKSLALLKKFPCDRPAARDMLLSLLDLPENEPLDFDSARQVAWGLRVLLPLVEPDWKARPALLKNLDALKTQLQLDLPVGQVRIEEFLPKVLQSMASYDPRDFAKSLRTMRAELSGTAK